MGHAAQNLALLRKLTLNLLRADQSVKDTMRGKSIRAVLCEKHPPNISKKSTILNNLALFFLKKA
jgi:hypothetical protein